MCKKCNEENEKKEILSDILEELGHPKAENMDVDNIPYIKQLNKNLGR